MLKSSFSTLLLFCFFKIFSQNDAEGLRVRVERMPFFQGCESLKNDDPAKRACSDKALSEFIAGRLQYPEAAKNAKLEGTVVVSFVVDENGRVGQESVLRDIGSDCGEAALAVVRAMPRWEAGQHEGKNVRVKMTLPIRFSLQPNELADAKSYTIHWGRLRGDRVEKRVLLDCLEQQLYVRDAYGNAVEVAELGFSIEKKRRLSEAKTTGNTLTKKMKKIVRKAPAGSVLIIEAMVQREGRFLVVQKEILIGN